MIGIVYLIGTVALLGTAKIVTGIHNSRDDYLYKENQKAKGRTTYTDHNGYSRDITTGLKVYPRINEYGDKILYTMTGGNYSGLYRDVRNISKEEREKKLIIEIERAKKDGKTVAKKYEEITALRLDKVNIPEKQEMTFQKVPTYEGVWWKTYRDKKRYIQGDRYYDINTGDEYIIREIYIKDKKTYFYMSTKTGHLIRRTDNQIINDKNNVSTNIISVNETDLFINKFNQMQDYNIKNISSNWGENYWYNGDVREKRKNIIYKGIELRVMSVNEDCDIIINNDKTNKLKNIL